MRKLLTLIFVLLFAATAFGQGVDWFDGDLAAAKKQAAKEDKLILIDFYSDG